MHTALTGCWGEARIPPAPSPISCSILAQTLLALKGELLSTHEEPWKKKYCVEAILMEPWSGDKKELRVTESPTREPGMHVGVQAMGQGQVAAGGGSHAIGPMAPACVLASCMPHFFRVPSIVIQLSPQTLSLQFLPIRHFLLGDMESGTCLHILFPKVSHAWTRRNMIGKGKRARVFGVGTWFVTSAP